MPDPDPQVTSLRQFSMDQGVSLSCAGQHGVEGGVEGAAVHGEVLHRCDGVHCSSGVAS